MAKLRVALPTRRLARALGTSGLVVGSGIFVWQVYAGTPRQIHTQLATAVHPSARPTAVSARQSQQNRLEAEFLYLPSGIGDKFKMDPIDAKEELRSMIPKHLRKPWKQLRQANWGDYEQHLNAVRELARINLTDGEYRQVAQSAKRHTAVGLARTQDVDMRFFLPPPPLPDKMARTSTPKLFRELLSALPHADGSVHWKRKRFSRQKRLQKTSVR